MDFFGALVLLVLLTVIPVIPLIALAIKLTSPGPVFFRQRRSGLNGSPFTLYKFRTMGTNAKQLKHELEAMNEMNGPVFKVTNDPRVTPIGKFLRKYSLDELPQLFNVLRTEMSLVGPRPLPVDEVKRLKISPIAAASVSSPASPASGKSADATKFPISKSGCASTSNTLTTGRCGWI